MRHPGGSVKRCPCLEAIRVGEDDAGARSRRGPAGSGARVSIGQRRTRPRQLVVDALASFDDFRSAQEIHDAITARGDRVGRATVYRAACARWRSSQTST